MWDNYPVKTAKGQTLEKNVKYHRYPIMKVQENTLDEKARKYGHPARKVIDQTLDENIINKREGNTGREERICEIIMEGKRAVVHNTDT